MGECGCTTNDERYWFPAPKNQVYVLTISGGCIDCGAPPGVTIELLSKQSDEWREREWYLDGPLEFSDWRYGMGVAIATGFERSDFIKAASSSLVGLDSRDAGENGKIDEFGAEEVLKEMYGEVQFRPEIIKAHK